MKITLSNKFFTQLLQLDSESQHRVLSTCKQLTESDEDTVLQFEIPADAPEVLAELVSNAKKRVTNARRRRERRAANCARKSDKTDNQQCDVEYKTDDERASAEAVVEFYELAVNAVISAGNILNRADRVRIRQLAKALMKRMDNIAAITGNPPARSRRSA